MFVCSVYIKPNSILRTINRHFGYLDGVPFYDEEYFFLLHKRSVKDYLKIKKWVDAELMPFMTRKSVNKHHTSYELKNIAQKELGFYVSNGDIKLILLENGASFKEYFGSPNVSYPISQKFFRRNDPRAI